MELPWVCRAVISRLSNIKRRGVRVVNIEPLGYLVILCGLLAIFLGARFAMAVLCLAILLGSAAVLQMPVLGGASIQPSHFLLPFLLCGLILRPGQATAACSAMGSRGAGFWFAAYVLFSVMTAIFLPRIFAGATLVYSSARDHSGMMKTIAAPLAPGSSNVTQSVYLLGDLVCFLLVAGLARFGYAGAIVRALIVMSATCLLFAVLDLGTYFTGHADLLDPIRNANYTLHTGATFHGFKRIVGSYPEASAFGSVALALCTFLVILWLDQYPARAIGLITLLLAAAVLFSTSTTAYLASLVVIAMVVCFCLVSLATGRAHRRHNLFLASLLIVGPLAFMGLMLSPQAYAAMSDLFNGAIAQKMQSQSGEERTAWNTLALVSFIETSLLGAGLGTVRASSFLVALLSNVGLFGTLLFCFFLVRLVAGVLRQRLASANQRTLGLAALISSFAQITSATVSGSSTDLGLLFSVTSGLAAGYALGPMYEGPRARRALDVGQLQVRQGADRLSTALQSEGARA